MPSNATIRNFKSTARVAAMLAAVALAGCSGDRFANSSPPPAPAARAAAPRTVPLADMAGRWQLTSPGSGACAMGFGGAGGAVEGTIAPEGGCPGKFFTSRRWAFDQDALLIRSHTGEVLGRFSMPAPGRFEGQATSGEPLTLSR
jgi:hypothetical protein